MGYHNSNLAEKGKTMWNTEQVTWAPKGDNTDNALNVSHWGIHEFGKTIEFSNIIIKNDGMYNMVLDIYKSKNYNG